MPLEQLQITNSQYCSRHQRLLVEKFFALFSQFFRHREIFLHMFMSGVDFSRVRLACASRCFRGCHVHTIFTCGLGCLPSYFCTHLSSNELSHRCRFCLLRSIALFETVELTTKTKNKKWCPPLNLSQTGNSQRNTSLE